MTQPERGRAWAACLLLFALNAALVWPLWLPGELPYRDSIEGGYAGMARFLSDHPSPWGWNAWIYSGEPTRHMYPPVLLYVAAGLMKLLPFLHPEHVYRLLTVGLTCLQAPLLFLLVRQLTGRTGWALAASLAFTLLSPEYALYPAANQDRGLAHLAWRFQLLAKYGEGPHNAGLVLIPVAFLALWRKAPLWLSALALMLAAGVNWVAALALAWCGAMYCLVHLDFTREGWRRIGVAALAAIWAYALICFWYTPDLIGQVFLSWPQDAFQFKMGDAQRRALMGLLAGALALRLLFGRRITHRPLAWLVLCLYGFLYVSLAYYRFNVNPLPEARRYALEVSFFLFAAAGVALGLLAGRRPRLAVALALLALAPGAVQAKRYLKRDASRLRPVPREQTVEYRAASALNELRPAGRVFVSGGLRFRLHQWFPLPQLGGTFETGLPNRKPWNLNWHIRTGADSQPGQHAADALRELLSAGVEYVVIPTELSKEHYRDFLQPGLFAGVLEKVRDLGEEEIFRVPFRSQAHLIHPGEVPHGWTFPWLRFYSEAAADPRRPALQTEWQSSRRLVVRGPVPRFMWVSVKVNHDDGWLATQDGEPLEVDKDPLGYILLKPRPAARSEMVLDFGPTPPVQVCAAVSLAAWLVLVAQGLPFARRSKVLFRP